MQSESGSDPHPMFTRDLLPVTLFSLGYIVIAVLVTMRDANAEFMLYIGVLIILFGLIAWLHARVRLTMATLWCLSLWGLLHMAGGLLPIPPSWPIAGENHVLYSWWLIPGRLKFDQLVHAYGFGVTTWVCWQGLRAAVCPAVTLRPTFGLLTLCAAAGMGFGALNEVLEFVATLLVPETNVGGYINTGWDLVSNFAGAVSAAMLIRFGHRRRLPE